MQVSNPIHATHYRHPTFAILLSVGLILASGSIKELSAETSTQLTKEQVRELVALVSLEQEINTYVSAKYYIELQRNLDSAWPAAGQLAVTLAQSLATAEIEPYEIKDGTIRYKPAEDDSARPVWQDGDTLHLQNLLAIIRYDSRKLGLDATSIGPSAQGTQATLKRLILKINQERFRLIPQVSDAHVPASRYSVIDSGTLKNQPQDPIQATGTQSGPDSMQLYHSQRQALMDRAKSDIAAENQCQTNVSACWSGCSPSAPGTSCQVACNHAEDQCMAPLTKDVTEIWSEVDMLDKKYNYGYPSPH
jgi:hypothetical protein